MRSNNKKKTNKKDDLTNVIIIITTAVLVISIVILAIVLIKPAEEQQNPGEVATGPQTSHTPTPTEMIKQYDQITETGTVSQADSKVYNYFMSHYQDDYYLVNEVHFSIVTSEGQYTEYFETHTRAYSKNGYLYSDKKVASYDEKDYVSSSEVILRTPDKNYLLYPELNNYMEFDGTPYTNTISFPVDEFKTGTIKINGRDYYYEEYTDNNITYRYCFDDDGELKFDISTSVSGTITTRRIEYSKDVDYSLFTIPDNYELVN